MAQVYDCTPHCFQGYFCSQKCPLLDYCASFLHQELFLPPAATDKNVCWYYYYSLSQAETLFSSKDMMKNKLNWVKRQNVLVWFIYLIMNYTVLSPLFVGRFWRHFSLSVLLCLKSTFCFITCLSVCLLICLCLQHPPLSFSLSLYL